MFLYFINFKQLFFNAVNVYYFNGRKFSIFIEKLIQTSNLLSTPAKASHESPSSASSSEYQFLITKIRKLIWNEQIGTWDGRKLKM
jgi:hypothetical protein